MKTFLLLQLAGILFLAYMHISVQQQLCAANLACPTVTTPERCLTTDQICDTQPDCPSQNGEEPADEGGIGGLACELC